MMKKVVLIIMDGWGLGDKSKADAIYHANTPFIDGLYQQYPHSQLLTAAEHVGLPKGQMGNSEVGHLNIGAGRIVYQDLVKINKAIEDNTIDSNPVLADAFTYAKEKGCNVHFMGLVSDGGIHSHAKHLYKLCDMAKAADLNNVFIHAFTDGRDCDPKSGKEHIEKLLHHLDNSAGELVSVVGRYYAMDRDKRWERIKEAYHLLLEGKGVKTTSILNAIQQSYNNGITDEFIKPIVKVDADSYPIGRIKPRDVVICFNFRTDRCREITTVLTQKNMPEYGMHTISLHYITMTNYDDTFQNIHVVFGKENVHKTLGEILSKAGKKQIRIAETEKYSHVTFFFSGGREEKFENEQRILIHSPKVPTYDLQPEMSAYQVTDALIKELQKKKMDFVCLNYANTDMLGHTGIYPAIIKAVETVDKCVKKVVDAGLKNGYSFILTADHGNADYTINKNSTPNTAHTTNPVPCILIDQDFKQIKDGILSDLAPTILTLMGMDIPEEMTGEVLIPQVSQ